MRRLVILAATAAASLAAANVHAANVTLLSETFDGVTSGYSGSDPRRFGIPDIATFGADNDWSAARFEQPDGGDPRHDVGVQRYGGAGNDTPVGIGEDDGGLLISFDASNYVDISLTFDWRTFSAGDHDELVVGIFVGDLDAGHPEGFVDNQIDLRPTSHGGPGDGVWNWENGWIELFRAGPSNHFSTEVLSLSAADGASEFWLAFWMDGGEHDFFKIDNILVEAQVVPIPPALWLMGTAILGLIGLRRRG